MKTKMARSNNVFPLVPVKQARKPVAPKVASAQPVVRRASRKR